LQVVECYCTVYTLFAYQSSEKQLNNWCWYFWIVKKQKYIT